MPTFNNICFLQAYRICDVKLYLLQCCVARFLPVSDLFCATLTLDLPHAMISGQTTGEHLRNQVATVVHRYLKALLQGDHEYLCHVLFVR